MSYNKTDCAFLCKTMLHIAMLMLKQSLVWYHWFWCF